VRDEHIVERIHEVVHQDWENSHPLDLTDEGLMAELEAQDDNVVEDLALEGKKARGKS
jgi:cardiolipin synthase A/B